MVDPGRSLSYNITIQCSLDGFCFVVHDLEENTIIDIELYQTSDADGGDIVTEALKKTVFKKGLFDKPVHSARYIVGNRLNTLVPLECFDEQHPENLFRFSHDLPKGHTLSWETLPQLGCANIFAIPTNLEKSIRTLWNNVTITHQTSVFLNGVMRENSYDDKTVAYVNVNSRSFDLAIVNEGKLTFSNNFKFNTKDDFIYFLMFTLEQQQLSGQAVPVYLTGLITGNSEIVKLCERYIKRICFIKPDGSVKVDIALGGTPFQYYYIPYRTLS